MNFKIKEFCLIFIFLCAIFLIKAENSVFSKADSLMMAGDFFKSAIEYERIVFDNKDIDIQKKALLKKALVLKQAHRYTDAIKELNRIATRNINDPLLPQRTYQLVLCHYLNHNYNDAISTIEMYDFALAEHPVINDLTLLKILSYNQLYQYKKAKDLLAEWITLNPSYGTGQALLGTIYKGGRTPKYKNPEKAHNLSMFMPGSGHTYSGSIGEGAINFMLNATALSFGVWQVYIGYYFTGYFVGVTMLERFYTGGTKRAGILAEQKNRKNATLLNEKILTTIESL